MFNELKETQVKYSIETECQLKGHTGSWLTCALKIK